MKKILIVGAVLFAILVLPSLARADCQSSITLSPSAVYKNSSADLSWNITGALDTVDGSSSADTWGQCTGQTSHHISPTYPTPPATGPYPLSVSQDTTCSVWGFSNQVECGRQSATVKLKCDASVSWSSASIAYNGQSTRTITTGHADSATVSCDGGAETSIAANQTLTDTFSNLTADKTCTVKCYVVNGAAGSVSRGSQSATVTVASPAPVAGKGEIRVAAKTSAGAAVSGASWSFTQVPSGQASLADSRSTYSNVSFGTYALSVTAPSGYKFVSIQDGSGNVLSTTNSVSVQLCSNSPSPCGGGGGNPKPPSNLNLLLPIKVFAQTTPYFQLNLIFDPLPPSPTTGTVSVVAYGLDSSKGGRIDLPITWSLNGPGGFSNTVSSPGVSSKDYTGMAGGSYALTAPTVISVDGIRYILKTLAPCGDSTGGSCAQTLTIPSGGDTPIVNPPGKTPDKPNPVLQPIKPGILPPEKDIQMPFLHIPGFIRSLADLGGWMEKLFPRSSALKADAQSVPQISFTLYYAPKAPPTACGAACDPTTPQGKTRIGSLTVDPSTLYDGTQHTITISGAVPYAPGALYKIYQEWDNYYPPSGRSRAVGGGGGGVGSPRTTTVPPLAEEAEPWITLDSSGNSTQRRTSSCANDGGGVPVKGFRQEASYLDFDWTSTDGYVSPTVVDYRDCRGTIKIKGNYNPVAEITWTLKGPSNWSADPTKPIPLTNTNISNYSGYKFQQFSQSADMLTISFFATDGTYTIGDLPDNCTADHVSQPLSPGGTTIFNITCNGAPGTGGPGTGLACNASSPTAITGQPVTFTASGGSGNYAWTANNANPASGSGTNFTTTFAGGGQNSASVSSSGSGTATCYVTSCPNNPTLTIAPTSASIKVGAQAGYTAWYDADGVGCGTGGGTDVSKDAGTAWDIVNKNTASNDGQGKFTGKLPSTTSISATYKGIKATAALNVNAAPGTSPDFSCTIAPQSFGVAQGASQTGTIACSPINSFTGKIDMTPVNLPQGSTMVITPAGSGSIPPNPDTYNYIFTAGKNTPLGAYTFQVSALSAKNGNNAGQDITHSLDVSPTISAPVPSLTVALTPSPTRGTGSLDVNLKAEIGQHTTGSYTYHFWWHCLSSATTVNGAKADGCSAPDYDSQPTSAATLTIPHTYGPGTYSPKVVVEQNNLSAADGGNLGVNIVVTPPPQPSLTVKLTPNPTTGIDPLKVDLKADVGEHTTGPYTYYFWWNCKSTATTLDGAKADGCGDGPDYIQSTDAMTTTATHTYSIGTYTPKVILQQNKLAATDGGGLGVNIVVTGTPKHAECVANTCQQVPDSPGNTADRCTSNCSCGSTDQSCGVGTTCSDAAAWNGTFMYNKNAVVHEGGRYYSSLQGGNIDHDPVNSLQVWWSIKNDCPTGGQVYTCDTATAWNANATYPLNYVVSYTNGVYYISKQNGNTGNIPPDKPAWWSVQSCPVGQIHAVCDPVQKACINVGGPGSNSCDNDPGCGGPPGSHIICENNTCVIVGGVGANDKGCNAVGNSCTTVETNGACTLNASPKIIKQGDSSVITWNCTAGISKCDLLDPNGSLVARDGGSFSVSVSPSASTKYTLSCNKGTYQVPISVYVVQSYKETNPGSQ